MQDAAREAGAAVAAATQRADKQQAAAQAQQALPQSVGPSLPWSPRSRHLKRRPPLPEKAAPQVPPALVLAGVASMLGYQSTAPSRWLTAEGVSSASCLHKI